MTTITDQELELIRRQGRSPAAYINQRLGLGKETTRRIVAQIDQRRRTDWRQIADKEL